MALASRASSARCRAKGATVQGELEAALTRMAGAPIVLEAAGRTDSGVHATGQVVSFSTEARHDREATWQRALNALLPQISRCGPYVALVTSSHARKSALARSYRYRTLLRSGTDAVARAVRLASGVSGWMSRQCGKRRRRCSASTTLARSAPVRAMIARRATAGIQCGG